ncbi:MAG: hypothetical protein LKI42_05535 [Bacteroidales bacterium]|jgi:uncharacterized protein (TIGR02145 family)|nr:hypothetical protein [Bacteroidales bacterium]MCI1785400.1 hypothetical protein [Bacteroidales bacterium]
MKYRRVIAYPLALVVMALGVISCHSSDDDDSTSGYLDGTMSFDIPSYVSPGDVYKLVPTGIKHPDGKNLGYYWIISETMDANDTTKLESDGHDVDSSFTFTAPADLGDYTIKCAAFADGYYDSSSSATVTVVSSELNTSLTGTGIKESNTHITDPRDGNVYYYMSVGNLLWFKQNLAYDGSGAPFDDAAAMAKIFGKYYTWNEAVTACPAGWRLPTENDWVNLAKSLDNTYDFKAGETFYGVSGGLMANAYFNDDKMWEYWPSVNITNKSGFSAIPAGYSIVTGDSNKFYGEDEYAVFWTADDYDSDQGVIRYMNVNKPDVLIGEADKSSFAASVRCVKDN